MRIQHNIMAMSAYRNYTNNVSAMKKNLEKLSSGYKINRAGDDAAGLAISEKMRAQITGLETAQKNAKDGISLVQTAEGALTEVHDMLNRMVQLATQSANGTYDNDVDRAQMQKELDQLRSEINRIADSSNFNGIKLLDGSMEADTSEYKLTGQAALGILATAGADSLKAGTSTIIHSTSKDATKTSFEVELGNVSFGTKGNGTGKVGIQVGTAKISVQFSTSGGSKTTQLGGATLATKLQQSLTNGKIQLGGVTYTVKADGSKLVFEMDDLSLEKSTNSASFNANFQVTAITDAANSEQASGSVNLGAQNIVEGNPKVNGTLANTTTSAAVTKAFFEDGKALTVGDTTYVFVTKKETAEAVAAAGDKFVAVDLSDLADDDGVLSDTKAQGLGYDSALNAAASRLTEAAKDNEMFTVGVDNSHKLTFQEKEGYNGDGKDGRADLTTLDGIKAQLQTGTFGEVVTKAQKGDGKGLMLQIGDTAEDFNQLKVSIGDMHCESLGIKTISIADQASAAKAVDAIKAAINKVSDVRGTLGATQNRLDHTINNLSVMTENIQDAESTIRDTDVAEEMMAYTKNNILIQSAQAMLAQANQVPQGVLQLLQ